MLNTIIRIPIEPTEPFFIFLVNGGYALLFLIIPGLIGLMFLNSKLVYSAMLVAGILFLLIENELISFGLFLILLIVAVIVFSLLFWIKHKKHYDKDNV